MPFTPAINVDAGTGAVDSPSPATVDDDAEIPHRREGDAIQESHLRKAVVALPEGMGLNPSGSVGLGECTDAQFKKGVRTYANACPANSSDRLGRDRLAAAGETADRLDLRRHAEELESRIG